MLILPGDPEFDRTLATPPPNWSQSMARYGGECAFVARSGSGILEPVSLQNLDDYLEGGEYEQRLLESGQDEAWLDAFADEDELDYGAYLATIGDCDPPAVFLG